jgi:uroporphyrinogen-III synthase
MSDQKRQKLLDVILLKSNDESESNGMTTKKDRYIQALEAQNSPALVASTHHINLLKFAHVNLSEIYTRINNCILSSNSTEHDNYKCLILTSRQAIESIQLAFETTTDINAKSSKIDNDYEWVEEIEKYDVNKTRLVIYCVGDATKTRLKHFVQENLIKLYPNILEKIIVRTPSSSTMPGSIHKQNAKSLASLIVDDFSILKSQMNISTTNKYALYPCSSIRKNDLSNELKKNLIPLDEIVAYETVKDDEAVMRLHSNLEKYFTPNSNDDDRLCCLVFFSPSGCDAVFNTKNAKRQENLSSHFMFISIGPSTSVKLKEFVSNVHELREPSPEALVEKLKTLL